MWVGVGDAGRAGGAEMHHLGMLHPCFGELEGRVRLAEWVGEGGGG